MFALFRRKNVQAVQEVYRCVHHVVDTKCLFIDSKYYCMFEKGDQTHCKSKEGAQ